MRLEMLKNYTRTIRLDIQYDGTHYVGWQRQAKGDSIQSKLEDAMSKIANEKVTLFAAGRTDAGVHARKQVVSASLMKSKTPIRAFVEGTNTLLPPDIRVNAAYEEKIDFLAITSAKTKIYRYYFRYAPIEDVFLKTVWQSRFKFDLAKMKTAAKAIVGEHDFSCFQTHGKETKTSIRKILRATIKKDGPVRHSPAKSLDEAWGEDGDIYFLEIEGTGFLRHMVRAIMGTLMDIGNGKIPDDHMKKILESKSRIKAGRTAPANALFLWDVKLK
jgi:tRNA pseudouridine38-40 synthase